MGSSPTGHPTKKSADALHRRIFLFSGVPGGTRTARHCRRQGNQQPGGLLISARVPISRNVYRGRTLSGGVPSGTRTATTTTAACGRNREELLGPRSDFSKPCQGAAEKSANATRKALTARFCRGSQSVGMSTKTNAVLMLCIGGFFYLVGVLSGTRTATTTTAACGRNREELLGPCSDFSKPCQGAAEKSANATRKALTVRFCCGSHPLGMSTEELPAAVQNSGLFYLVGVPGGTLPPRQYFLLKKHVQSLWKTVVSRGLHMLFCSALFLYCSQRFICCRICAISALE